MNADMLADELAVLEKVEHPNIARIIDLKRDSTEVHIVMDYFEEGDLFDYVTTRELTEDHIASIMYQLLYAVNYLHDNGIVHRDIKLENVLIESKEECKVMLADFGFAAKVPTGIEKQLKTQLGTDWYMAPEILEKKPYDTKVDVWSLGVVAFMCFTKSPPYKG